MALSGPSQGSEMADAYFRNNSGTLRGSDWNEGQEESESPDFGKRMSLVLRNKKCYINKDISFLADPSHRKTMLAQEYH